MNPLLILARIFFPISILKYPLLGGALAIYLDNLDWHTKHLFGINPIFEYQFIDKILDTYYLCLLAYVALRFQNKLVRNITLGLFIYRIIGFLLFEITQVRLFLFFFPNIFENFFFFYYIIKAVAGYEPKIKVPTTAVFLLIVTIPKMLQEYSIHVIDRPLVIHISSYAYTYQGTFHQIAYLLTIAIIIGWVLRKRKLYS